MQLPPEAQVWVEADPDNAWSVNDHLLAAAVHALNLANWQRGGGKGKQPTPVSLPSEIIAKRERDDRLLERIHAARNRKRAEEA